MLASVGCGIDPALCRSSPLGLFCLCAEGGFIGSFQIRKWLPAKKKKKSLFSFIGSKKAILIVNELFRTRKSRLRVSALIGIIWGH